MEPIGTRDLTAAAHAYNALESPVALGHQFRPRQGCTCGVYECPWPGAHPLPGGIEPLDAADIDCATAAAPGAGLLALTRRCDALTVPRQVGLAVQVRMDDIATIPCAMYRATVALLVPPASGFYAATRPWMHVRSGPGGWIALPPSHNVRWDQAPWTDATYTPHKLPHGRELGHQLTQALENLRAKKARPGCTGASPMNRVVRRADLALSVSSWLLSAAKDRAEATAQRSGPGIMMLRRGREVGIPRRARSHFRVTEITAPLRDDITTMSLPVRDAVERHQPGDRALTPDQRKSPAQRGAGQHRPHGGPPHQGPGPPGRAGWPPSSARKTWPATDLPHRLP